MYVGATNKKILEDKIGFQKLTEDFDDLSYIAEKVFINPVLGTSEVTFVTTGFIFIFMLLIRNLISEISCIT